MGLGCCSTDKNSRTNKSDQHEGGSSRNDSMMEYQNQKRRPHLRPQDMHLKNNEFKRQLSTKFKDYNQYKRA